MDTSKIIQYSPPRSGSTLVWNILRVGYPNKNVVKQHGLTDEQRSEDFKHPIITTVRNPLDIISSAVQRYGKQFDDKSVYGQVKEMTANGMFDFLGIADHKNVKLLRYEKFVDDWDYLFNEIETFLGEEIPKHLKEKCNKEFNIGNVKTKADQLREFGNWDGKTHIHGKHISKFKGTPNHYKETLSESQIEYVKNEYKEILNFLEDFS